MSAAMAAEAATVWTGPRMTFNKLAGADPALPANQDRISSNVWVTRGSSEGLFNIRTESVYTHNASPAGTRWASGSTSNYASLNYTDWEAWTKTFGGPASIVGHEAVLHLMADDIYLDIRFTAWGVRPTSGGFFAYERSTLAPAANEPPIVQISSPTNGATFQASAAIAVQVDASDSDGTVAEVQLFDGSTLLGTDTTSPFSFIVNLAPGSHHLIARATDNREGVTVSEVVAVSVTSVPIDNPIAERIAKGDLSIELRLVADGLISPLGMAAPDDGSGRAFIYDQAGVIWLLRPSGMEDVPVLDVRSRLVSFGNYDERGLLGVACHPNFAQNPLIYTYTSEPAAGPADFTSTAAAHNHQSVIAEWRIDAANPNRVDPATRREIVRIDKPQGNHNGGTMRFGPGGLYISIGDGGQADDQGSGHLPDGNAQNIGNIYGKIIRIDVDGRSSANGQYGIPIDNPFAGQDGLDEIFAYGLRNPFSFSFDRGNPGSLYLADVGQNKIEEIDLIVNGGNYGWRVKEGTFYFDPNGANPGYVTDAPVVTVPPGLIDPIAQYDHDDGQAGVGGYVYRGSHIAALAGRYVFGDWGSFNTPSGRLYYLDAGNVIKEFRIGGNDRAFGHWIKGFGEDASGELYVMATRTLGPNLNTGRVFKIVPGPDPLALTQVATPSTAETTMAWAGGQGPFVLQGKTRIDDPTWMNRWFTHLNSATTPQIASQSFFRVGDTALQLPIPLTAWLTTNAAAAASSSATAMGSGIFSLNGNLLRFDIEYRDLSGVSTLAHIHGPGTTTDSVGVQVNLAPYNGGAFGTSGRFTGTATLSDAQKAMVLAGRTYVNIHTPANGGGEIRGQIVPVLMTASLSGANAIPAIDTPGHGIGVAMLVYNQLTMNLTYRDLMSPATLAHIHGRASVTENAGVLVNLASFNGGAFGASGRLAGTTTLTPSQLAAVIDGLTYVNIHTVNHGGGEIRGQLLPQSTAVPLTAYLSPEAAGVNAPGASGDGQFSLEGDTLVFSITYGGLSGAATLAHIHGPASSASTASPLVNLAPFNGGAFGASGTIAGAVVLTPSQRSNLMAGLTYVNIHTANNGGGEIRGQIGPVLLQTRLNGGNERPAPVLTTSAYGSGLFALVGNRLSLNVNYLGLTGTATGAHIHGPATVSQSANVLVNLAPYSVGAFGASGSMAGTIELTPPQLGNVIDTMTYVNIHTGTFGGGEIRGQILR